MKACPLCHGPGAKKNGVGESGLLRCRGCRFVHADATDEQIKQVNFH